MHDLRARGRGHQRERLRHATVDRRRAEAAADDEQPQRTRAAGEPRRGRRHATDRVAHRIADPLDLRRVPAAQRIREAEQDPVGGVGEHAIRESRDRVGLVQHQRPRERDARERAREGREAAESQHDVRRAAADDLRALPARGEQRERPEHGGLPSLAADAAERHALELDAVLTHERPFHAVARAKPEHAPAAPDELRRDGEPRKDVATGAAGGDHHGAGHWCAPLALRAAPSEREEFAPWDGPAALIR